MLGVVVFTSGKCIEAASQAINRGIKVDVIVIREDDVEVAIELSGGQLMESLRHQR